MCPEITLVYREKPTSFWNDRCTYLSEEYTPHKKYTHRSILPNEVVLEYDLENKKLNKALAQTVISRLIRDEMVYSAWFTGNKSTHVHFFVDVENAKRVNTLKKAVLLYYGVLWYNETSLDISGTPKEGYKKATPDLKLASPSLIRLEYGLHEATQEQKKKLSESDNYPKIRPIKKSIWELYMSLVKGELNAEIKKNEELDSLKGFRYILTSHEFREADDGRERALFMLIHTLKPKYQTKKNDLIIFLQDWYKYSGGTKLKPEAIRHKVNYHWNKSYTITQNYLNELLYSIGREDLIEKKQNIYKEITPNNKVEVSNNES